MGTKHPRGRKKEDLRRPIRRTGYEKRKASDLPLLRVYSKTKSRDFSSIVGKRKQSKKKACLGEMGGKRRTEYGQRLGWQFSRRGSLRKV